MEATGAGPDAAVLEEEVTELRAVQAMMQRELDSLAELARDQAAKLKESEAAVSQLQDERQKANPKVGPEPSRSLN